MSYTAVLKSWRTLGLGLLVLLAPAAPAADAVLAAKVLAARQPAWVDVDGKLTLAAGGVNVPVNAALLTGANGRIQVALPDGSEIFVAAKTRLILDEAGKSGSSPVVHESMRLVSGALRFVTGALAKARQREVKVVLPTSTIGIRGTDFYTEAEADEDKVCLLEGDINVSHMAGSEYRLHEPRQFYSAKRADKLPVVGKATEKQIQDWLGNTSLTGKDDD